MVLARGSGTQETVTVQELYPGYQGALLVCAGGDDPQVRGGEDGYLSVNVEAPSNETQLLLRSFALGIQEIREAYGHNFINIRYKED